VSLRDRINYYTTLLSFSCFLSLANSAFSQAKTDQILPVSVYVPRDPLDIGFIVGATIGQSEDIAFGGLNSGVKVSRSSSQNWSWFVGANLLLDLANSRIIGKGVNIGYVYYLVGGPRYIADQIGSATLYVRHKLSIGFLLESHYLLYHAVDANIKTKQIQGAVLDNKAGLEIMTSLSPTTSFDITVRGSVMPLPASEDNLVVSAVDLLFGLRLLL
jgi:hypothetical protein